MITSRFIGYCRPCWIFLFSAIYWYSDSTTSLHNYDLVGRSNALPWLHQSSKYSVCSGVSVIGIKDASEKRFRNTQRENTSATQLWSQQDGDSYGLSAGWVNTFAKNTSGFLFIHFHYSSMFWQRHQGCLRKMKESQENSLKFEDNSRLAVFQVSNQAGE